MGQRKRSPFSSPSWDKIPWKKHPKAVKDKLIDLMQEVPELLEYIEEFKASTDPLRRQELEAFIMGRCNEVRAGLDAWGAERGDAIHRFDRFANVGPLEPPRNDAEFAFHHLTTIYWFTIGTISCIKSFFTSRQGEERIPEREPGWYVNYEGATTGTPSASAATPGSTTNTSEYNDEGQSPASSGKGTVPPVSVTEHYLWESAVYATREVCAMHFFFAEDAGVAHSAAGLMSLAVLLRYYSHPASFCVLGNEVEILQSLYNIPIMGIPIGQLMRRILGGYLPPLVANIGGPKFSHGLGWF